MKRIKISPRVNYKKKIEALGFDFHDNYWKEDAYYKFNISEIDSLEKASKECYEMYCEACEFVIKEAKKGNFEYFNKLQIPELLRNAIIRSWDDDDLSLYGRFDFAYLPDGSIKLLEFNADTPTSLLEASIIQWNWKEDLFKNDDQFNCIHEALVQSWIDIHDIYNFDLYHFMCDRNNIEDQETTEYILSTAMEAGVNTAEIDMDQMYVDDEDMVLRDPANEEIGCCFKLYPWEWMMRENPEACDLGTAWIEPIWKALMSNKAMLPILYQLFPDSQYLLKTEFTPGSLKSYCKKPIFSREGSNITLVKDGKVIEESNDEGYGDEGYVYQELVELPKYDDRFPIIGSWIIGGESCGIGIRETTNRITDNMAYFIPHIIEAYEEC